MRVTMNQTRDGSPDGIKVLTYTEGETYDMPDDLGAVFLCEGWAKESKSAPVSEPKPEPDPPAKPKGRSR